MAAGLDDDGALPVQSRAARGRSSMAERQLPKLHTRVRFPSPAPISQHPRFGLTIHAETASKIPARRHDFFALCQSQAAAKIGIRCTDPDAQMMPDMAWGGMQWQNSLVGLLRSALAYSVLLRRMRKA